MRQKSVIDYIQEDYPAYDPLAGIPEATGHSLETIRAAADRVRCDGYYGPIRATDWQEQDGREPSSVDDALAVLRDVAAEIVDYVRTDFEACDAEYGDPCDQWDETLEGCGGHEYASERIDASEIADALFPFIREIYGCGVRSL